MRIVGFVLILLGLPLLVLRALADTPNPLQKRIGLIFVGAGVGLFVLAELVGA